MRRAGVGKDAGSLGAPSLDAPDVGDVGDVDDVDDGALGSARGGSSGGSPEPSRSSGSLTGRPTWGWAPGLSTLRQERALSLAFASALVRGARAWQGLWVSTALTQGIRVTVSTVYVPSQSAPTSHRYVFAYTIRIANEGHQTAQLKSRHWVITHGNGKVEEVRGPGVVGQQPSLKPGEHFEYTSGCILETPRGTMRGTYQMVTADGAGFDAEISSFQLAMPHSLN